MNKEQFMSFIDNPSLIDSSHAKEIQQLVEQYPYFQTARILFLKSLFDNKSISYQSELKLTAAYAGNRSLLQSFIVNQHVAQTISESSVSKEKETIDKSENSKPISTHKRTIIDFDFNDFQVIHQAFELPSVVNESKITDNEKQKQQFELINKFIKNEPRIIPKETGIDQKRDLASESAMDTEFLTETLADIYVQQKKYERAIEMFEKLSLKFPQKSVYFASRVSEIKKSINQDKK